MYCKLPMGHTRISRLRGAGFVAALAVLAMACHSSENDNGVGASNQPPAFNNTVLSITPAADGSGDVYVGGDFTTYNGAQTIRIVRLNANGTIDPAFATGVGFNGSVHNIVPGEVRRITGDTACVRGRRLYHLQRDTGNSHRAPQCQWSVRSSLRDGDRIQQYCVQHRSGRRWERRSLCRRCLQHLQRYRGEQPRAAERRLICGSNLDHGNRV